MLAAQSLEKIRLRNRVTRYVCKAPNRAGNTYMCSIHKNFRYMYVCHWYIFKASKRLGNKMHVQRAQDFGCRYICHRYICRASKRLGN